MISSWMYSERIDEVAEQDIRRESQHCHARAEHDAQRERLPIS